MMLLVESHDEDKHMFQLVETHDENLNMVPLMVRSHDMKDKVQSPNEQHIFGINKEYESVQNIKELCETVNLMNRQSFTMCR